MSPPLLQEIDELPLPPPRVPQFSVELSIVKQSHLSLFPPTKTLVLSDRSLNPLRQRQFFPSPPLLHHKSLYQGSRPQSGLNIQGSARWPEARLMTLSCLSVLPSQKSFTRQNSIFPLSQTPWRNRFFLIIFPVKRPLPLSLWIILGSISVPYVRVPTLVEVVS